MEKQIPVQPSAASGPDQNKNGLFGIGDEAIYALHGKCRILGIEEREVGGNRIPFYKLELVKSALSRSTRQEPHIWLPVAAAKDKGLRAPMSQEEAEQALAILNSREYYLDPREPWAQIQPRLDQMIRTEGGTGLAKVYSFLHVLRHRQIVPASEVQKLFDSVARILFRELCEAIQITPKALEEKIRKGLRQKLLADH